jgi:hypothetical protein
MGWRESSGRPRNLTEVQTFRQYVAEKKIAPASKAALLNYYRQRASL